MDPDFTTRIEDTYGEALTRQTDLSGTVVQFSAALTIAPAFKSPNPKRTSNHKPTL